MSTHKPRLLYRHKFVNPNVDRIVDTEDNLFKPDGKYKIQDVQKRDVVPDPLLDLDEKRKVKERITVINVDSRDREIHPRNIFDDRLYRLRNNPLEFRAGDNKVVVYVRNHDFILNDKFAMNNVVGYSRKLKHRLFLYEASQYAKIVDETHVMTYEYHNRGLLVNISGVRGELFNGSYGPDVRDISINLFNKNHEILFNTLPQDNMDPIITTDNDLINLLNDIDFINSRDISELDDLDSFQTLLEENLITGINPLDNSVTNFQDVVNKLVPNFYLIKLPKDATSNYSPDVETNQDLENSCIRTKLLHLFGIPLSSLNADYPLSFEKRFGSHNIIRLDDTNKLIICVNNIALEPRDTADPNKFLGGGSCIDIAKITGAHDGYPNPNHYKVFLSRTFHSIKRVELVSTIFPNTERVFKASPKEKQNNKLYWNVLADGDTEYSIEITPGNYTAESLTKEITDKIKVIPRSTYEFRKNKIDDADLSLYYCDPQTEFKDYLEETIIETIINEDTDVVTFSAFDRIFLKRSICEFNQDGSFTVFHPFHPYNDEDENVVSIIINGSTDICTGTDTFPAESINGTHLILEILTPHTYKVEHDRTTTLENAGPKNYGGDNLEITFPIKFRMLFNKQDTMGNELGFNMVGEPNAVTPFTYTVNNVDFYETDVNYNSVGVQFDRKNLILNTSGDSYILMTNEILSNFENTGPVQNIFAKIQLNECCNRDSVNGESRRVFNSYVNSPKIFEDPLTSLSEIEFMFYGRDNILYNFNGADHSFCLRIVELINLPINSHISARTGSILQTYSTKDIFVQ